MSEQKLRAAIRTIIASINEKYPHVPLLQWQDFEDQIIYLIQENKLRVGASQD